MDLLNKIQKVIYLDRPLLRKSVFVALALLVSQNILAQKASLDFQFGINIPKPLVLNGENIKSKLSHNFFVGFNYRTMLTERGAINLGFFTNFINYRFSSTDSPKVSFLTMYTLSAPLQWQWTFAGSRYSILAGIEPKVILSGYENLSKIDFTTQNGVFNRYNLGLRLGAGYKIQQLNYFLQLNSDLFPFKAYNSTRIYDFKLLFGFTFFPILLQK